MNNKKRRYYLISGIGPGPGGVGRLMRKLVLTAEARGFRVVYRDDGTSLRPLLKQGRILSLAKALFLRHWKRFCFSLQIRYISDANILFLHPQTAGMRNLFRLAKRNKVFLYVMDNSFFCMRSYNLHPGDQSECLQCIEAPQNADPLCTPFPSNINKSTEIDLLKELRKTAKDLFFLAQNARQAQLLRAVFGDIEIELVGLDTGEVPYENHTPKSNNKLPHSIVFHGATHLAKGIGYFIGLAERLPELRFVVPDNRENVEQAIGRPITAENVHFQPCNWESGLAELVSDSTLVVNPSLWSAPIEGALVKSLAFNCNVATVKTSYGYEGEIAKQTGHLRLDKNLDAAASQVRRYLDALECGRTPSQKYEETQLFFPNGSKNVLDVVQTTESYAH